jgi:hexokinase
MDKAEDLFDWIGDCIAEVVAESLTSDDTKKDIPAELDMGITFSFPIMSVFHLLEKKLLIFWGSYKVASCLMLMNMQARILG